MKRSNIESEHLVPGYGSPSYQPNAHHLSENWKEPQSAKRLKKLLWGSLILYLLMQATVIFVVATRDLSEQGASQQDVEEIGSLLVGMNVIWPILGTLLPVIIYFSTYSGLKKRSNTARYAGIFMAVAGIFSMSSQVVRSLDDVQMWVPIAQGAIFIAFALVNIWWIMTALNKEVVAWFNPGKVEF